MKDWIMFSEKLLNYRVTKLLRKGKYRFIFSRLNNLITLKLPKLMAGVCNNALFAGLAGIGVSVRFRFAVAIVGIGI